MDIEGIEKTEGKVCTKCGQWKPLEEYNKSKKGKYGRRSECRKCQKEYNKQYEENNKEHIKEYHKQHYQNNKEHYKQYRENNKENRKEYDKQRYQNIKEHRKEYRKQYHQNNKDNNLQYISSIVEQINPVFKQSNLPIYGYVYMFENVKTNKRYIGQTINPIKTRYRNGIIKGWIKERLEYNTQKFTEELIEEDFKITETLDVAFCQYHLDKLEAYYINKYNSCENGYNNEHGNHNTDNGIEEFNEILKTYNLQYIDGKLIKAPTQE